MRNKLLSALALTILIASTLVGCGQASSAPSTLTIISITEGDVFIMKSGTDDWIEASVEMSLEVGDTIKTGDDSGAEITFFDGSTLELEAGTEVEITSLDSSADTGATTITLMQTIGTTISRVTKLLDPASSYEVETPSGVAAVRGSWMIVRVVFDDPNYEDGTTLITNQEGNIYAIVEGVELQVPEGQQAIIRPNQLAELIPLNRLSLAVNDSAITDEDTTLTVAAPGVLDNDSGLIASDTLAVTAVDTSATVGTVATWDPDGSFTYDPDGQFEYLSAGSSAADSFTYTVSDGYGGTDTATVTVTINGVNDVPTDINLDNSSVAEDQYYGTVVGNFSTIDPDTGDTFTYSLVSGDGDDNNTSFMIVDGSLQTINSFDYETTNYCSIRVRSTDSGMLYYEEAFTINITNVDNPPVNYPPVALDDSDTTPADTPVTIDVLNNDSDPDNDLLTVDSVTQGIHGSVTNNGDDVTYTPDSGFSGTDSFTYTVSDGNGGTDTATVTVTVTVTNVNNPPAAVDDSASTSQDTPVTIDVLNNDSDTDGDTLTVDSVTQGTHGSVTNNGDDVTYTPDSGFNGTDSFTYTVSDGNGGTDTATVTVAVTVLEMTARIRITVDQGPTAPIYVRDTTTGEMVVDGNVVASATIQVAGEHSYCVWVGGDATRYVNSCPDSWSGVGTETACGHATAGSLYPVHFTQSTPS